MKTLFIRNLPFDASEADLRKAFEVFGRVTRCSIAKNRDTGESRGFGFIDIDEEVAARAILEMNGKTFANRTIVVQESESRSRPANGPQNGGSARDGARPAANAQPPGNGSGRPSGPSGGATAGARQPHPRESQQTATQQKPAPPGTAGAPHRPTGMNRAAASPASRHPGAMSRAAVSRRSDPGQNKQFGPDAAPAAERFKAYSERPKDRLKPYKREQFDFRGALNDESEEGGNKGRPNDGDGAPPVE